MSGIEDLARKGRNGDNTLMHVSTDEVAGLNSLARSMMGRELTQNPDTGLPEAFLFTPFLAPAVAGGLGLGGGALATGLTAGALGATEAAVRGMDDPLERGLYSGLTAGAASGIGNALSGAAEAGQAAGQAGQAGSQAATTSAPDLGEAVKGAGSGGSAGTGFSVTNPSVSGQPSVPTGDLSIAGMGAGSQAPTTSLAGSSMTQVPGPPTPSGAATTMSSVTPPPSASAQFPSGSNFDVTSTTQPPGPLGQYGDIPQMAEGAKNIFTDPTGQAGRQFMSQAQMPIAAGAAGLGGQAQMRARDEMKERADEAKAEKEADRRQAEDQIRSSYAAVGRPMPTPIGGGSLFQQGGIVNLRAGGNPGAPGGESGARGGAATGSSSSGGGGGSSHPGRPGGESGERGMSRGGGGGGSSPAVQNTRQLDSQAIRSAVISPMDDLSQGIKSIAMMSPTMRALSYLARDRRALGGSSGLAPGAPGAGEAPSSPQGRGTGNGGNGGNNGSSPQPIIPPQVVAEPAVPTMRTEPSQARNMFLDELQQGAGNRMAMQQTGYGMAEGGYLDGGMLPGDGMSDDVPASIDGEQPAALSSGEFVIPADVVSHIGNGSSDSGAKELYAMMDRIRKARTGEDDQAPQVNARKMMPK